MCSNVLSVYRFMCLWRQMFTVIKPSLISWMYAPVRLCAAICFCKVLHLSHMFLAAHNCWLYRYSAPLNCDKKVLHKVNVITCV